MKQTLLKVLTHPTPLRVVATRKLVKYFSLLSYPQRLDMAAVDRPHYGHCIHEAVKLAARLKYPEISVVEFGCGGGNGLLNAEMHIAEIEKLYAVKVQLYGFDNATGLPPTEDYRDFPHYFRRGQFRMDVDALRKRLTRAKLVIGDVAETRTRFLQDFKPAPIGAILHDLDFYSSTRDALQLFDVESKYFLPRVFMYFDDINGNNTWLPSEHTGELLAINEFNQTHDSRKIAVNRSMPHWYRDQGWLNQIYIYHDFQHPDYNVFVGGAESALHDGDIELR
ncbi:hypothetical protein [Rhodopila sp.]|uniref:hypothetical protein n=1 Tax=Rhodopila sp. TaxID=2480087 RepID=UPI003D0BECA0